MLSKFCTSSWNRFPGLVKFISGNAQCTLKTQRKSGMELKIQIWLHSDTRIQFQILRVTKYKI